MAAAAESLAVAVSMAWPPTAPMARSQAVTRSEEAAATFDMRWARSAAWARSPACTDRGVGVGLGDVEVGVGVFVTTADVAWTVAAAVSTADAEYVEDGVEVAIEEA